jgi:hypothetical protein
VRVETSRCIHHGGVETPRCLHHRGVVSDTGESFYEFLIACQNRSRDNQLENCQGGGGGM